MIRVRITQPPSRSRTRDSPSAVRMLARTSPLVLRRPGGLSGVPRTRSHLELGRQTHQRPWYCVSRHGRVGRRQACPAQETPPFPHTQRFGAGWSSPVARQAHNLKVAGSNPAPATNITTPPRNTTARRLAPRGPFDVPGRTTRAARRPWIGPPAQRGEGTSAIRSIPEDGRPRITEPPRRAAKLQGRDGVARP